MSTFYYYKIDNANNDTSLEQLIQVGSRALRFKFQWAIASEEQFDMVVKYLKDKADTDPILRSSGDYDRSYDWYTYYYSLVGVDLDAWLATDPELPNSIKTASTVARQKELLNLNISEAQTLRPIILLYTEVMRWQFSVSTSDTDTIAGVVESGGWYRNQDTKYSFMFYTNRDVITKDSLSEVYIVFEVYDE